MRTAAALALLALLVPAAAFAAPVTVEGKDYPDTLTVEGKALKRVGAGLREKWSFDVYAMGAYSEDGGCEPSDIIRKDVVKHLRLDMLRNVSAEKMGGTIADSLRKHMPAGASDALRRQADDFGGFFTKPCSKGARLEITYVPGSGTTLRQDGQAMGPTLPGPEFMRVLWDVYFGPETCCDALKEQILGTCGR